MYAGLCMAKHSKTGCLAIIACVEVSRGRSCSPYRDRDPRSRRCSLLEKRSRHYLFSAVVVSGGAACAPVFRALRARYEPIFEEYARVALRESIFEGLR